MNTQMISSNWAHSQRGQAFLIVAIFVGIFLLAVMGLATDYAQLWAHRQIAQGAADAACQAGAADLFLQYNSPTPPSGISYSWFSSHSSFKLSRLSDQLAMQVRSIQRLYGDTLVWSGSAAWWLYTAIPRHAMSRRVGKSFASAGHANRQYPSRSVHGDLWRERRPRVCVFPESES